MKVVLDVNILASASTFPERKPATVLKRVAGREFELILSEPIMERLADVLTRPYFAAKLSEATSLHFQAYLRRNACMKEPDPTVVGIAPDTEDDLVLGTAVAANAEYLVTGDKGLLAVGEYRGVRIVTAEEFLRELERSGDCQ